MTPIPHPNPTLQKNLTALAPHSPHLIPLLPQPLPPAWLPTPGTDSTPTFQLLHSGHIEWLGHTSMPAASAIPLTASMLPGNANGLGLGIGTGFEWQHLLTRLQSHQALFVLEPDPALAALALSICDLSAPLATAKLILLLGPNPESQLAAWLANHPGLEPPTVMHPLPTLPNAQRHALLATGEAIIRAAVLTRANQFETAARALQQIKPTPNSTLAMLVTPRHKWDRVALASTVALASCQCSITLDHHLTGGRLARINLCLQQKPAAIFSDVFRHQLQIPLPPEVSLQTQIPPTANIAFWQPDYLNPAKPMAPHDLLIAHSTAHKDLLTKHGFPATQIHITPWHGRPAHVPTALLTTSNSPSITMVASLPSTDPATYGITLPSHVALWQAATDLITEDPLAIHWDLTADIFRRAQQRASVQVTDPALAESLQSGIRHALMEAILPLTLARQLHAANIPLILIGDGWQQPSWHWHLPSGQSNLTSNVQFLPFPAPSTPTPWQPGIYLHISPSGTIPPSLLDAITAAIPIAAATHPLDTRPAGICNLLTEQTEFLRLTRQSWLPQLRALLADAPRRARLAAAAQQKLRATKTAPVSF